MFFKIYSISKDCRKILKEAEKPTLLQCFLAQLKDPMLIILLIAAGVSALAGWLAGENEWAEVIIILAVVLLNAILGVVQESKAEAAIEALQTMTAATCKVLRDGKMVILHSDELVPGDVVMLEAGDAVPADGRIIENASLKIEEAALTGESVPVNKMLEALGMEKAEPDTMNRPPRNSKEGIFAGGLFFDIAYQGILVTAITIVSYIIGHCFEVGHFEMPTGISPDGMTMAFLTMSMCEIFHSFNMRSQRKSVFSLKGQNKILWLAMIGSLLLTTAVLKIPFLANAFGFEMISWTEYAVAMGLAFLVIPIVELVKLIQRAVAKK